MECFTQEDMFKMVMGGGGGGKLMQEKWLLRSRTGSSKKNVVFPFPKGLSNCCQKI